MKRVLLELSAAIGFYFVAPVVMLSLVWIAMQLAHLHIFWWWDIVAHWFFGPL